MKAEDQVCTLRQGEEIEKLGVKAESLWMWVIRIDEQPTYLAISETFPKWHYKVRAYTGTELGVLLGIHKCQSTGDINEARLRADKLIYCVKHELIKPEGLKL